MQAHRRLGKRVSYCRWPSWAGNGVAGADRFAGGAPMWTNENRTLYDRSKLRYPSDLTDAEWALIEPLIPPAKRGGGKRTVVMRDVVNGVMYILSTGCQWRALPKDLPPRSTVHGYLDLWNWDGTLDRIHHVLYVKCREKAGRDAKPDGGDHRQPEREKRGKRGRGIDPCGTTRARKSKEEAPRPCRYARLAMRPRCAYSLRAMSG